MVTAQGRILAHNVNLTPERATADQTRQIRRTAPDQSNTSVIFGWQLIMKMFRRLEPGPNPDVEIGGFLTQRGFARIPPLLGTVSYERHGDEPASMIMLQQYVPNQGNGWQVTLEEISRYLDRVLTLPPPQASRDEARAWMSSSEPQPPVHVADAIRTYLATAEVLGRRTGELHVQIAAAPDDPAFAPEPYTAADLRHTVDTMRAQGAEHLQLLAASLDKLDQRRRDLAAIVLGKRDDLLQQFDEIARVSSAGGRIRCHGDYHLGQVLVTEGDVVILDFEGEPARPLAERRAKCTPMRDVAGMVRSFSYAALTGLGVATKTRPEDVERLAPWVELWETWVSATFLRAYFAATRGATFLPPESDDLETLLQGFVLDKALYELAYELNNRPDWVHIPLAGLLRLRAPLHA
jgi:maltose alpha-D-glucosyltransferase / alpha-amylase